MNFETLQQHWQQQETRSQVKVDASLILQEVRRNHRSFQAMIFWRDFREVGAALFVAVFIIIHGRDWTDWLLAVAGAGVGIFLLRDHLRQRKQRPRASARRVPEESARARAGLSTAAAPRVLNVQPISRGE